MKNPTGRIIRFMGIAIIAVGFALGACAAFYTAKATRGSNAIIPFIAISLGSFVSGMLLIGFSEIIFLLQDNKDILLKDDYEEPEYAESIDLIEFDKDGYGNYKCPNCSKIIGVNEDDIKTGGFYCPYCDEPIVVE